MTGRTRPQRILQEINSLASYLVNTGIARLQDYSIQRTAGKFTDVTFSTAKSVGAALKDQPYEQIHGLLIIDKAFNIEMIDNALLQFMYRFDERQMTPIALRSAFSGWTGGVSALADSS